MFSGFLNRIKKTNQDIAKMRSLKELFDYIPEQLPRRLSFVLLLLLVSMPVIIMVRNIVSAANGMTDEMLAMSGRAVLWLTALQIFGSIGLMTGLLMFAKSVIKARENRMKLLSYLSSHALPVFLLLMLLWSAVSCILSDNSRISWYGAAFRQEGLLAYIAYAGIFCCAWQVREMRLVSVILDLMSSVASLLSLLVILDAGFLNKFLGFGIKSGIFNNANHFGYYLCLASMVSLYLLLRENSGRLRLACQLTGYIMITAALAFNQSFGPFLAVVFGMVLFFICAGKFSLVGRRRLAAAGMTFIAVTVAMNLATESLLSDMVRLLLDSKSILTGSEAAAEAGSGRWKLWVGGVRFITEKPLFGYGPDNLGKQYLLAGIAIDRPHNEFIQFAASLGVPALLFYLAALASHAVSFIRKHFLETLAGIGFFCMIAAYLVSSFFGNTMYYTTPYFLMILGISGGLAACPSHHLVGVDVDRDSRIAEIKMV